MHCRYHNHIVAGLTTWSSTSVARDHDQLDFGDDSTYTERQYSDVDIGTRQRGARRDNRGFKDVHSVLNANNTDCGCLILLKI